MRNDPFFAAYPEWISAIQELLAMGVRASSRRSPSGG